MPAAAPKGILRDCHITAVRDHVQTQERQDSIQGILFSAHLFSGLHTQISFHHVNCFRVQMLRGNSEGTKCYFVLVWRLRWEGKTKECLLVYFMFDMLKKSHM